MARAPALPPPPEPPLLLGHAAPPAPSSAPAPASATEPANQLVAAARRSVAEFDLQDDRGSKRSAAIRTPPGPSKPRPTPAAGQKKSRGACAVGAALAAAAPPAAAPQPSTSSNIGPQLLCAPAPAASSSTDANSANTTPLALLPAATVATLTDPRLVALRADLAAAPDRQMALMIANQTLDMLKSGVPGEEEMLEAINAVYMEMWPRGRA